MLDPRNLAENRTRILDSCRKRGVSADVDAAITAQEAVAACQTELNELNRQRNEHQQAGRTNLDPADRESHTREGRRLKGAIAQRDEKLKRAQSRLEALVLALPNFVHPDVPEGGEENFAELRRWGEIPDFSFEALDHLALGERLDLFDFEHGAAVAGPKFYFLKNEAVLLELALQRFALDVLIRKGFTPYTTPDLARAEIVDGIGYNPRGEETQIYSIANSNLCLIGTAEIALGGLYESSILEEEVLPLRLAGVSHCFRTEAGSHGRESKGLYRVHQFTKVEMFVYSRPDDSEAMHEEILSIEEDIYQALELPYRVIDVAAGDLGAPAYRKFDLEVWMPGRGDAGDWGEVTSASNCTDFQARRLRIRFRLEGAKRNEMVHTLNGTAVANPRTILALLEVHQRPDGSIGIPKALQPYMGCDAIGPR